MVDKPKPGESGAYTTALPHVSEMLDLVGVVIVGLDTDGLVATINRHGCELTGYTEEELIGRPWIELCVPERFRQHAKRVFHKVIRKGEPTNIRAPLMTRDGDERMLMWCNRRLQSDDGEPLGTLSSGLDVTAAEQAEARAAEQAAHLSAMVERAVDGIISIDQNGTILSFNPAAEEMFGYPRDEAVGQNVSLIMPEPDRSQHDGYLTNYLRTGEARIIGIGREVMARRRDGSLFPAELAVSEVVVGEARFFTGMVRDITKRREAEEALRQAERRNQALQLSLTQLERAAVAGELASIVAHEVRTPLNALAINAQMIKRMVQRDGPGDRDKVLGLLRTLETEVERINNLLEQQLKSARPQRATPASEPVVVNAVVEEALRFMGFLAAKNQVEIVGRLAENLPVHRGDQARLRQVLFNLLLNALQAMPDGGRIDVTTERAEDGLLIRIADTGPGIPPEIADNLFQPFVTSKPEGTGLGLAICDRLVRKMGGTIAVDSRAGEGAVFEVRFPT